VKELTDLDASWGATSRSPVVWGSPLGATLFSPGGGYVTCALKRPVMVSPRLKIACTLYFPTSSLNRV
jgi:hypothetical protein